MWDDYKGLNKYLINKINSIITTTLNKCVIDERMKGANAAITLLEK